MRRMGLRSVALSELGNRRAGYGAKDLTAGLSPTGGRRSHDSRLLECLEYL